MKSDTSIPLPSGASLIEPQQVTIGNWREQTIDAEITYRGIRWVRVRGGFGDGHHPRQDWLADLPSLGLHVKCYLAKPDEWGDVCRKQTMHEAMDTAIARGVATVAGEITRVAKKHTNLLITAHDLIVATGRSE